MTDDVRNVRELAHRVSAAARHVDGAGDRVRATFRRVRARRAASFVAMAACAAAVVAVAFAWRASRPALEWSVVDARKGVAKGVVDGPVCAANPQPTDAPR